MRREDEKVAGSGAETNDSGNGEKETRTEPRGASREAIKSHERERRGAARVALSRFALGAVHTQRSAQRDSATRLLFAGSASIVRFLWSDLPPRSRTGSSLPGSISVSVSVTQERAGARERKLILAKCAVIKLPRDAVIM